MKIAQITCVYPPYKGGIAASAENFARVLKSAGQEVKTFTIDYGKGKSQPEAGIIRLKPFPRRGKGGFLPLICWRLKSFDLAYLHYPFFGAAESLWFLKKFIWKKKKKLVIQYHMDTVLPNLLLKILSLPSSLIFNSLFKNADLIVSASLDYIKNSRLKNIYAKYPEKFVEIPFGVDLEKFKPYRCHPERSEGSGSSSTQKIKMASYSVLEGSDPSRRAQDDKDGMDLDQDGKFTILFVGGLDRAHYFKGVDVLLEAVAKITPSNNWQLNIAGSGGLEENYKIKARELGIADKVDFLGQVSDEELPEKYRQADCFVLPSINKGEAFGIVLIEAMASGLPLVASDLPGVRGVFTSESGLLIKPGNAEDLKNKIEFLMKNPAKRQEMGEAARREVEEKYSLAKISARLIKLLIN